jgi:excinuclease ABC subunit B
VAEQVIRPTGLLDPEVEIRPTKDQIPDLLAAAEERIARGERVLVTALTKRLCEDLATFLDKKGLRVRYLHSDIETLDRVQILTDLRLGNFDVLVGVNLLREGLDLPEVSLVCILDADKEGFLRSPTSLIQQMGRAARNVNSRVIMYADKMTPAMSSAIGETERRRVKQIAYNTANGITPTTIKKAIRTGIDAELKARKRARETVDSSEIDVEIDQLIAVTREEMLTAAEKLDFEQAAALRDHLQKLQQKRADLSRLGESTKIRPSSVAPGTKAARAKGKPGAPGTRPGKRGKPGR